MISTGPPGDGQGAQRSPAPDATDTLIKPPPSSSTATVPVQLRRRVQAARRLPPLSSGVADPLVPADHDDWRDRHDLAMAAAGLAPPWQAERARQLWRDGAR